MNNELGLNVIEELYNEMKTASLHPNVKLERHGASNLVARSTISNRRITIASDICHYDAEFFIKLHSTFPKIKHYIETIENELSIRDEERNIFTRNVVKRSSDKLGITIQHEDFLEALAIEERQRKNRLGIL